MKKKFVSVFAASMMILSMNSVLAKKGLNKTSLKLYTGKKATLKVSGAKRVKWSTNSKNVTVKSGVVTAKKAGKATVYAKVDSTTYKCKVTVASKPQMSFNVTSPTSAANSKLKVTVKSKGGFATKKYQYKYTLNGKTKVFKAYTKSKTASFTATKDGTYKITVTMKDGLNTKISTSTSIVIKTTSGQSQSVNTKPTTSNKSSSDSPSIDEFVPSETELHLGDTFTLNAKVSNTDAKTTYQMVAKDANGTKVASSSSSLLTFKVSALTTYTISMTVVNSNGLKAVRHIQFTTRKPLIQPKTWTPHVGSTRTVYVENANANVKWTYTSSDPTVASVDADGNVTALKAGTTTITASYNGIIAEGAFKVTVS